MGIAAMIIGIVSVILGFIPFCGFFAFMPAIVGLILGIIDTIQKNKTNAPKGMAISGVAMNAVAILVILLWGLIFTAASVQAEMESRKPTTTL